MSFVVSRCVLHVNLPVGNTFGEEKDAIADCSCGYAGVSGARIRKSLPATPRSSVAGNIPIRGFVVDALTKQVQLAGSGKRRNLCVCRTRARHFGPVCPVTLSRSHLDENPLAGKPLDEQV